MSIQQEEVVLGQLGSGEIVVQRRNPHDHGLPLELLQEAFNRIRSNECLVERGRWNVEVNLGRVVGKTICITTSDGDQIFFAQRKGRPWHSRLVRGRGPEECNHIFVVLLPMKDEDGKCVLITAFVGRKAEIEPGERSFNPNLTDEDVARSRAFWDSHALVAEAVAVEPGTERLDNPWTFTA